MAENEGNLTKPPKGAKAAETVGVSNVVGLHMPFPEKDVVIEKADGSLASKVEGVDPETLLFHGVDPETKERLTVTLEGLQAQFGKELGEKKYLRIAGIADGSIFFNPRSEATSFRPPLGISGLQRSLEDLTEQYGAEDGAKKYEANQKHFAKIASILETKE